MQALKKFFNNLLDLIVHTVCRHKLSALGVGIKFWRKLEF